MQDQLEPTEEEQILERQPEEEAIRLAGHEEPDRVREGMLSEEGEE